MKSLAILLIATQLISCVKSDDITTPGGNNNGGNNNGGNTNDPPTVTAPSTQFIAFQNYTVENFGAYDLQSFTINETTSFVLRFTSQYKSQAAVITPAELNNFENMNAFSGYASFNNTIGTQSVILAPGDYYVGVRNTASSANEYSLELDYVTSFPSSDKCNFYDNYFKDTKAFANGGSITQPFTVQKGYRYFLDGDNVGFSTYIIPASDLTAFQNNQSFNYYSDYLDESGNGPGFYEITLPPGDYVFAARSIGISSITYTMERWKVN